MIGSKPTAVTDRPFHKRPFSFSSNHSTTIPSSQHAVPPSLTVAPLLSKKPPLLNSSTLYQPPGFQNSFHLHALLPIVAVLSKYKLICLPRQTFYKQAPQFHFYHPHSTRAFCGSISFWISVFLLRHPSSILVPLLLIVPLIDSPMLSWIVLKPSLLHLHVSLNVKSQSILHSAASSPTYLWY